VYTDGLLVKLSNAGVGFFLFLFFVGVLAYANDLAPTPTAKLMRKLLCICDEYGKDFSIKFNEIKSKWLAVVPRKRRWLSSQLVFCQFHVGGYHHR